MPPAKPRDWLDWLEEAHNLVNEWEHSRETASIVEMNDAAQLAELIAAGRQKAFEQGTARSASPRDDATPGRVPYGPFARHHSGLR